MNSHKELGEVKAENERLWLLHEKVVGKEAKLVVDDHKFAGLQATSPPV